jgi:hypothetical protein
MQSHRSKCTIQGQAFQGNYRTLDRRYRMATFLQMIKLSDLDKLFPKEEACKLFLFEHRWPDGKVSMSALQ